MPLRRSYEYLEEMYHYILEKCEAGKTKSSPDLSFLIEYKIHDLPPETLKIFCDGNNSISSRNTVSTRSSMNSMGSGGGRIS